MMFLLYFVLFSVSAKEFHLYLYNWSDNKYSESWNNQKPKDIKLKIILLGILWNKLVGFYATMVVSLA